MKQTIAVVFSFFLGLVLYMLLGAYQTGDLVLSGQSFVGKPAYGTIAATPAAGLLVVDIVTKDVAVEVLPVTAPLAGNSSCFDESANGRLRYICATTRNFFCNTTISGHTHAGANQALWLTLGVSGTPVVTTQTNFLSSNTTDDDSVFTLIQTPLSQNQYVSAWLANTTGTQDIDVETFRISCWPVDQ